MADQFNVTGVITPSAPTTGQNIKVTISGDDVHTVARQGTVALTLHLVAEGPGVTEDIQVTAPYTEIVTTHESVKIASVSDSSGRTWAIAPDGLSASAVA